MLIVVSGLPGVGKSTVAALLADRLGAVHLSVDPIEEALLAAGLEPGPTTGVAAYEAVRAAAELNLAPGRTVVVDAVNDSELARDTWRRAATAAGAELVWVVLTISDAALHAERLRGRSRGFERVPEPTWAEVEARAVAPWRDPHLALDTTALTVPEVVLAVERHLESRA